MSLPLSPNTQSILLLTAPLLAGRGEPSAEILTPGEYKRLARFLHERRRQPADLLGSEAESLLADYASVINRDRLRALLDRGFQLSQAVDRWQTRAIWLVSRADAAYPRRVKERLKDDAPPILYGCGEAALLETGGLAVVGSRQVDEALIAYTEAVGRLAAKAGRTLVSGGARGIDQAAMRGALDEGGTVVGVLADSLERSAMNREHRNLVMREQLVLISPYDPLAGFNVGHAMQRNKLIYALADAALVVSSDYQKGGTWAGAVEQLEKLRLVPVFVPSNGHASEGLKALSQKGALPWPNPTTPEEFAAVLARAADATNRFPTQEQLRLTSLGERRQVYQVHASEPGAPVFGQQPANDQSPAEVLFATVRSLLERMDSAKADTEVAAELQVSRTQAKEWLQRLVDEGVLEKTSRPVRYRAVSGPVAQASMFERRE